MRPQAGLGNRMLKAGGRLPTRGKSLEAVTRDTVAEEAEP